MKNQARISGLFLCLMGLGALASAQAPQSAQAPAGDEGMLEVARGAKRDMEASSAALAQLREDIATEKLPLAQELTALEEQVLELRREQDASSRLVDSGNLALTGIKTEIKARQDELDYLANFLDEYARTFESKVNVSELQALGSAIEETKALGEKPELTRAEKFAQQLGFVDLSVKRLGDAVGGMRFPGVAVDLSGAVVEGQYAILGPVALFCSKAGAAGLVVPQSGSNLPLIRPLEGALQVGLTTLVQSGEGLLPLDPSLGAALKALVQKTSLWKIFEKGGPIMWPLLVAAVLALGTVIERLFFLANERRKRDGKALERLFAELGKGDLSAALRIAQETRDYVVRALGYALAHKEQSLPSALLYAQAQELKRFRRGVAVLDTVITLAPLLGLLGTVTGMMGSFALIGGELSAPGAITGGIAEALIATAFGLGIAITALLPFNFLNARLDEARHELESAATQLELLMHPHMSASSAPEAHPTKTVEPPARHLVGAGKE